MMTPRWPDTTSHAFARLSALIAVLSALLTYLSWLYPDALASVPIPSAIQWITFFWVSVAARLVSPFCFTDRRNQHSSCFSSPCCYCVLARPLPHSPSGRCEVLPRNFVTHAVHS